MFSLPMTMLLAASGPDRIRALSGVSATGVVGTQTPPEPATALYNALSAGTTYTIGTTDQEDVQLISLSSTKTLKLYDTYGDEQNLLASVITNSGEVLSVGAPNTIFTNGSIFGNPQWGVKIDDTHVVVFVLCYDAVPPYAGNDLWASVLTISGDTVTPGTWVFVDALVAGGGQTFSAALLDSSRVFVAYSAPYTSAETWGVIMSISGTTLTKNTPAYVVQYVGGDPLHIRKLTTDKILVWWEALGAGDYSIGQLLNVSGTTWTLGDLTDRWDGQSGDNVQLGLAVMDATTAIAVGCDAAKTMYAFAIKVVGNALVPQPRVYIADASWAEFQDISIEAITADVAVLYWNDPAANSGYMQTLHLNGGNILVNDPTTPFTNTNNISRTFAPYSNTKLIAFAQENGGYNSEHKVITLSETSALSTLAVGANYALGNTYATRKVITKLTGKTYFVTWSKNSLIYASILTDTGGVLTEGATYQMVSYPNVSGAMTVALDRNHVLMTVGVNSTTGGYTEGELYCFTCSVEGTVITQGNQNLVASDLAWPYNAELELIGMSKAVVTYTKNTTSKTFGRVIEVSQTNVVTMGTATEIYNAETNYRSLNRINEDKLLLTFADSSTTPSSKLYAVVLTISGTTISAGATSAEIGSGQTNYAASTVLTPTTALVTYVPSAGTNYCRTLTISGTTVTGGTAYSVPAAGGDYYEPPNITRLNTKQAVLFWLCNGGADTYVSLVSNASGVVSFSSPVAVKTGGTYMYMSSKSCRMSEKRILTYSENDGADGAAQYNIITAS